MDLLKQLLSKLGIDVPEGAEINEEQGRYNARRILPPVLQHLQTVVQKLVYRLMADQT